MSMESCAREMPMHSFYQESPSICFYNYIFVWQNTNRAGIYCQAEPDAHIGNELAEDESVALGG